MAFQHPLNRQTVICGDQAELCGTLNIAAADRLAFVVRVPIANF